MSVYRCGPTAVGSRASWGPVPPASPAADKPFPRPLSGNFDRIFNIFERSNAFEYVKSTSNCNGEAERRIGRADVVARPKSVNRNDTEVKTKNVARLDTIIKNDALTTRDHTVRAGSEARSDSTAQSDTEGRSDNENTTKSNVALRSDNDTAKSNSVVKSDTDMTKSNAVIRSENTTVVKSETMMRSDTMTWSGSGLERADCALAACAPADDDEDFYREKIMYSQARQLFPLQEDLADWINKTIGITYLTGDNFLDVLDNGVELCQLAAVIQERAREALRDGTSLGPVPTLRGRCWERAARRSFFSRDNTENFITFCRELGVHENLLFESDDLVLHHQPRQVIVCLLEVSRLAARLGLEPPGLVELEREIAQQEHDSALADHTLWQFRQHSPPPPHKSIEENQETLEQNESGICMTDNADAESTKSEGTVGSTDSDVPLRPTNELDKRVQLVTRLMERGCRCGAGKCSRLLKVKKLGEGRYNIAGRNVFIRLLKGRHMMVRVGGGWDTLEHFLSRHEPCQVRLVTPRQAAILPLHPPSAPRSPSPVDSKASSISGSVSPLDRQPSVSSKASTASGSSSPPHQRRTSTPIRNSPRANRTGLTLPLKSNSVDQHRPTTPRSRKSSIPSAASTPVTPGTPTTRSGRATPTTKSGRATPVEFRKSLTTSSLLNAPKKTRSMSVATSKEDTFCGTERLNRARQKSASAATTPVEPVAKNIRSQSAMSVAVEPKKTQMYGKKGRSMSVAQAAPFRPLGGRTVSAAAMTVTPVTGLTQADIEESIRRSLAASIADDCPNKPFLHIKAKYRSPPPREVPPR